METTKKLQPQSDSPKEPCIRNTVPRINDDYGVINSEDDSKSMDENEEDDEETSEHLIKVFGSSANKDLQSEIHETVGKKGLSLKGRKEEK